MILASPWNTLDVVNTAGGEAVQSKSGHSFIKEKMREVNASFMVAK